MHALPLGLGSKVILLTVLAMLRSMPSISAGCERAEFQTVPLPSGNIGRSGEPSAILRAFELIGPTTVNTKGVRP
jgi:hypothetical protein